MPVTTVEEGLGEMQEFGTYSESLTWMSGAQVLYPSPVAPRLCIHRKLDLKWNKD